MKKSFWLTLVIAAMALAIISGCTSPTATPTAAAPTGSPPYTAGIPSTATPTSINTATPANTAPAPTQTPTPGPGSETPPTATVLPTPAAPTIQISYTPVFVWQTGVGYTLVLNVAIHNYGYPSFQVSPDRFSVIVSNRDYGCETSLSDLASGSIPDGGKLLGKLAFIVPTSASSTKVGFSVKYSGDQVYNIQWLEVR